MAHAKGTGFVGTCYSWNTATYDQAGCEHFGVGLTGNATRVTSRWLVPDAVNGGLVPHDPAMPVPFASYYAPPVVADAPPAPPVIEVQIEAPEPAEAPELYGPAQWVKVFVRQLPRAVTLDELVADNPLVVPMDPGQLEINWDVIQAEPASNSNGNRRRSQKQGSSTLDASTRSVIRRYEMYRYTGPVDPITNEALCADLTCSLPAEGELGDFVSAQMTAANVQGDFLTIRPAGTGKGNIDSSDKIISCGSKCASPYTAGTNVTLAAKPSSGSVFAGWTGACAGTATTCTVPVNGDVIVGAMFNTQTATTGGGGTTTPSTTKPVLTVKTAGGKGLIVSNAGGINCGKTCSASVTAGTAVALTATPEAGFTFVNWTGACTGTAPTCTVTVNANASAQANFTK